MAHEYLGNSVEGKDVFIADDIISSGESMLDIAYELKKRKATPHFRLCDLCHLHQRAGGIRQGVRGRRDFRRARHQPDLPHARRCKSREWFCEVDVSKYIAYFIAALNHDVSVSVIIDPHQKIKQLLEKYR